jgi:cation/acetate symporter
MLGISPEGIGFIGMLLNFLTSILVSRFFQSPSEEIVELIDRVRLP